MINNIPKARYDVLYPIKLSGYSLPFKKNVHSRSQSLQLSNMSDTSDVKLCLKDMGRKVWNLIASKYWQITWNWLHRHQTNSWCLFGVRRGWSPRSTSAWWTTPPGITTSLKRKVFNDYVSTRRWFIGLTSMKVQVSQSDEYIYLSDYQLSVTLL